MTANKEQYRLLCETEGSAIPLFQQYWWMETVCQGKHWDVALAYDQAGRIVAALPYLLGTRLGLRYVLQPQLTQYNGPWFRPEADRLAATRQLTARLTALRLTLFVQHFGPQVSDLSGWEDYRTSERVTYRIEDISDPRQVFDNMDKKERQKAIRRAEKQLTLVEDVTPEEFATLHEAYWQSRGQKDLLSHNFIVNVVGTALSSGHGILLGARDESGEMQGIRFAVYDDHCGYSLMAAFRPQHHHNGVSALLFWNILQRLSGRTQSFDFEGSMDPGIAYSYRLYGSQPVRYYEVSYCRIPLLRRLLKV